MNLEEFLNDSYKIFGEVVEILTEAEYQGRKVELNKPFAGDNKHKR